MEWSRICRMRMGRVSGINNHNLKLSTVRGYSSRAGNGCAHHVAQERLEHQERPQWRAVVASPRLVILDHPAQMGRVEPACIRKYWPEHRILDSLAQGTAEP